ncbi:hypothetical protein [Paraburkholderia sediminicola]|uniref:hypothetical protein n=1 Tax=Paraburkholderia sediminicola TaxID=458836 RepID=UPI0038BB1C7B
MTVDRRTFIMGTTLIATAPALAKLMALSSTVQVDASVLPDLSPQQLAADRADANRDLFKIDGWERRDDLAIDGSTIASAEDATHDLTNDQILISINQSWRATWR